MGRVGTQRGRQVEREEVERQAGRERAVDR